MHIQFGVIRALLCLVGFKTSDCGEWNHPMHNLGPHDVVEGVFDIVTTTFMCCQFQNQLYLATNYYTNKGQMDFVTLNIGGWICHWKPR